MMVFIRWFIFINTKINSHKEKKNLKRFPQKEKILKDKKRFKKIIINKKRLLQMITNKNTCV